MFRCGNLKFRNYYFSNLTRLDDREETIYIPRIRIKYYLGTHFLFSLYFSTFTTILITQLPFSKYYTSHS
jgi:hypothetical protein